MTDKDKKGNSIQMDHLSDDDLNAKMGVLMRREVEARILTPMLDALGTNLDEIKYGKSLNGQ